MSTYLVLGGTGFIGSHLSNTLAKQGHRVIVVDDLSTGFVEYLDMNRNIKFVECDIANVEWFKTWYKNDKELNQVDCVFLLAAQARIQPTIVNPRLSHDTNITGVLNVLEMMRELNIKNIVFSSSSSIYGLKNDLPLAENMPHDCLNPYSMSKFFGEQYIKTWCKLYGLRGVSLRYFNVFGPREVLVGQYAPVVGIFFRQALQDKTPLTIVGDGEQRRDFTYVEDVVDANIKAAKLMMGYPMNGNVFNVGTGENYSVNEVKDMVLESLGMSKDYYVHIPPRPAEARETRANNEAADLFLGWKPKHTLKTALPELTKYYLEKFKV